MRLAIQMQVPLFRDFRTFEPGGGKLATKIEESSHAVGKFATSEFKFHEIRTAVQSWTIGFFTCGLWTWWNFTVEHTDTVRLTQAYSSLLVQIEFVKLIELFASQLIKQSNKWSLWSNIFDCYRAAHLRILHFASFRLNFSSNIFFRFKWSNFC